jgi:hypothetical protein
MAAPDYIPPFQTTDPEFWALVECPGCEKNHWATKAQVRGKVSMDCPSCEYHETHDITEQGKHL